MLRIQRERERRFAGREVPIGSARRHSSERHRPGVLRGIASSSSTWKAMTIGSCMASGSSTHAS